MHSVQKVSASNIDLPKRKFLLVMSKFIGQLLPHLHILTKGKHGLLQKVLWVPLSVKPVLWVLQRKHFPSLGRLLLYAATSVTTCGLTTGVGNAEELADIVVNSSQQFTN